MLHAELPHFDGFSIFHLLNFSVNKQLFDLVIALLYPSLLCSMTYTNSYISQMGKLKLREDVVCQEDP